MSKSARSAQEKRLSSLVKAMEEIYGEAELQSGSNGDEYIFPCPLCVKERGENHRKHLRVCEPIEERDYPYVGCRNHTDNWNEIRKALVKAGVSDSLLAKADKTPSEAPARAPKNSGPGLGEEDPIDPDIINQACRVLLKSPGAEKYKKYLLEERGLTEETIKKFRIGVSKVYARPRITIPIKNIHGNYVNVRCYLPFGRGKQDVKILPWPHSTKKKKGTDKSETYGAPARLFGIGDIVAGDPIFVCAGEFDRLLMMQNGFLTVTGTGAEGTVPRLEDCKILVQASEIYIIYDCDDAGRKGAKKLCASLMKIGAEKIKVLDLNPERGDGYDITDFFVADGKRREDLEELVEGTEFAQPPEPPVELNDRHMAEVVSEEYIDQVRFLADSDAWLRWDGRRWQPGGKKDVNEPSNAVIDMARTLRDESMSEGFPKRAKAYEGYLKTNQIRAVVTQMAWLEEMRVTTSKLDSQRHLFNVRNGTVDLNSGKIYDQDPRHLISKIARGIYKPGLKHGMWDEFLDRFVPNKEMQRYLQRLTGYCIEDGNPHRLFIIFKGKTSTGKSAFSEAVMKSLGDYAGSFNLSLFREKQDESPRADIVQMLTQRIGFASETSSQWHLHADSIKRITGLDTIKARLLHSNNYVERIPAFTPIIRTNAAPTINGVDLATFRRLRVVPFDVQIPEDEVDPDFLHRMMREAGDAILSWVIDGYLDYKNNGFGTKPVECELAELQFQDETSLMAQFIADHCTTDPGDRVPVSDLYQAYQTWAMTSGFSARDTMNKIEFGRKLSGLGYESRVDGGIRYRTGIAIRGAERVIA